MVSRSRGVSLALLLSPQCFCSLPSVSGRGRHPAHFRSVSLNTDLLIPNLLRWADKCIHVMHPFVWKYSLLRLPKSLTLCKASLYLMRLFGMQQIAYLIRWNTG
ncbi:exported hypothetical protein [Nitrospira lenta]|uniref:Uncharacterized protein n=1 Tax=Nitrospira lenta TaxID=1436998 RepID=A0A330L4S2_9BACT|nr:exported hypothetical protein [Nitrospira lenta]